MTTIPRNTALREMDVRFDEANNRRFFSIKFVTKQGVLLYFPKCYSCGAGKMNNRRYRLRGIQPVDSEGKNFGHVYPVMIDSILFYNGHKVIL